MWINFPFSGFPLNQTDSTRSNVAFIASSVYLILADCHIDSCLRDFERARRNLESSLRKFSSANFVFDDISVDSCVFSGLEGMSKFGCNPHLKNVTVSAHVSRPTVLFKSSTARNDSPDFC